MVPKRLIWNVAVNETSLPASFDASLNSEGAVLFWMRGLGVLDHRKGSVTADSLLIESIKRLSL